MCCSRWSHKESDVTKQLTEQQVWNETLGPLVQNLKDFKTATEKKTRHRPFWTWGAVRPHRLYAMKPALRLEEARCEAYGQDFSWAERQHWAVRHLSSWLKQQALRKVKPLITYSDDIRGENVDSPCNHAQVEGQLNQCGYGVHLTVEGAPRNKRPQQWEARRDQSSEWKRTRGGWVQGQSGERFFKFFPLLPDKEHLEEVSEKDLNQSLG